jgi:6-bladed beta-propeller protein
VPTLLLALSLIVQTPPQNWSVIETTVVVPSEPLTRILRAGISPDSFLVLYDSQQPSLLAFGPDGELQKAIGRRGRGPGEFLQVRAFGWWDAELWLVDATLNRLSVFAKNGELKTTEPLALPGTVEGASGFSPVAGFQNGVRLFVEGSSITHRAQLALRGVRVVAMDSLGDAWEIASLDVAHEFVIATLAEGAQMQMFHPWAHSDLWDVDFAGEYFVKLVRKESVSYRLSWVDLRGETQFSVDVPVDPIPLPRSQVNEWVDETSDGRRDVSKAIRDSLWVPEYLPSTTEMVVGEDEIWIRRHPSGDAVRWDIVKPKEGLVGVLSLPADLDILAVRDGVIWGSRLTEFDEPVLVRIVIGHK